MHTKSKRGLGRLLTEAQSRRKRPSARALAVAAGAILALGRIVPVAAAHPVTSLVKAPTRSAATAAAPTPTGGAALLYTPTGLDVLGTTVIPAGGYVCTDGTLLGTPVPSPNPPICNLDSTGTIDPLAIVTLLTEKSGGGFAKSQVASVRLLPDAVTAPNCGGGAATCDLLDATVLTAQTHVFCNGVGSTQQARATIATLSIAGNEIVPDASQPQNVEISVPPGQPETGTLASVVLNYSATAGQHVDFLAPVPADTAEASSVALNLPQAGVLSPLAKGTLFVSYAESDMEGCASPPVICAEGSGAEEAGEDSDNEKNADGSTETAQQECDEESGEHPPVCAEGNGPEEAGEDSDNEKNADGSNETAQQECDEESSEHPPTTCPEDSGEGTEADNELNADGSPETAQQECDEESSEVTCHSGHNEQTEEDEAGEPAEDTNEESHESAQAECNEESSENHDQSNGGGNAPSNSVKSAGARVPSPGVDGSVLLVTLMGAPLITRRVRGMRRS